MISRRISTGLGLAIPAFVILSLSFSSKYAACFTTLLSGLALLGCVFEYLWMQKRTSRLNKGFLSALLISGPLTAFIMAIYQICYFEDARSQLVFNCLLASGAISLLVTWSLMSVFLWNRRHKKFEQVQVPSDVLFAFLMLSVGGSMFIASSLVPDVMLWVLFTVCLNDIAAYFVGRSYGRRPIARVLSPKKTVAGSVGGAVVGVLVSYLVYASLSFLNVDLSLPFHRDKGLFLSASALLVIGAQLGDLAESYIKRYHECKDSGGLLPGHGGVYDRLDATLGGMCVLIPLFIASRLIG